jgi:hypothetical protein
MLVPLGDWRALEAGARRRREAIDASTTPAPSASAVRPASRTSASSSRTLPGQVRNMHASTNAAAAESRKESSLRTRAR